MTWQGFRTKLVETVAVTRSLNDSALTEVKNDGTVSWKLNLGGNEALVEN